MAQHHPEANRPGQNGNEVALHQRGNRVGDHAQQQVPEDLDDALGRIAAHLRHIQRKFGGENKAGHHRHQRCDQGANHIQHEDTANMRGLAFLVCRNRCGNQHKHQDGCDGFKGGDEQLAQNREGFSRFRRHHGQQDTGDNA